LNETVTRAHKSEAQELRRGAGILSVAEGYALVAAWVVLIAVFCVWLPDTFATTRNAQLILGSQAVLLTVAIGLIISLAVGEFDLSVSAGVALSCQLFAVLTVRHGVGIASALAVVLLVAVAVGSVTSFLVVKIGVPSIVVTLGIGTLLDGIREWSTDNLVISGIPTQLTDAVSTKVWGVPLAFYYALVLCAVAWYFLQRTPWGRYLYFVGQNREVARLAGINVNSYRVGALICTPVIAALAGVVLVGTLGSSTPETGTTYLLPAFAAAFLGATAFVPGRFNAWGTFLAVYFLDTGFTGLQLAGYDSWVRDAFYGGSLVVAVALARIIATRREALG
jgi:ribose transport system permease protein